MRTSLAAAIAAGLSLANTAAQAADTSPAGLPCLSQAEGAALVTVIAPGVIRATSKLCAAQLGPNAYLTLRGDALANRFEVASASAWSVALPAIAKVAKTQAPDPEVVKALALTALVPVIATQIKPSVCRQADRTLGLLDPLPAANTAALLVQFLPAVLRKSGKQLPICIADPN